MQRTDSTTSRGTTRESSPQCEGGKQLGARSTSANAESVALDEDGWPSVFLTRTPSAMSLASMASLDSAASTVALDEDGWPSVFQADAQPAQLLCDGKRASASRRSAKPPSRPLVGVPTANYRQRKLNTMRAAQHGLSETHKKDPKPRSKNATPCEGPEA